MWSPSYSVQCFFLMFIAEKCYENCICTLCRIVGYLYTMTFTEVSRQEEIRRLRARQQARVVKAASPSNYIGTDNYYASPRVDLGSGSVPYYEPPPAGGDPPLKSGIYYVDDPHEMYRQRDKDNKNNR